MTWVLIRNKDRDKNEVVELAQAGHVRVEVDAVSGLISRLFHQEGIQGVEFCDEPKKGKGK